MNKEKSPAVKRSGAATSLRVSAVGLSLWEQLAARDGLNRTAYLEMTLRRLAAEKGIVVEADGGAAGEETE